jgi:hypothetical protein
VFAAMNAQIPFAIDVRDRIGCSLKQFAIDVYRFLRSPDENGTVSDSVKRYSAAVERAASDLGNRRIRRDELTILLTAAMENAN